MPPTRGRGGRTTGSRVNSFDVDYEFELFTLDDNGNLRTPGFDEEVPNTFTFPGAIENFTGRFSDTDDNFGFDVINITDRFIFTDSEELPTSFFPLTLDLTARYLPEGTPITLPDGTPAINSFDLSPLENVGTDRIEYILTNEVLENLGINELTLILEDADGDISNGFQVIVGDDGFIVTDADLDRSNGFQLEFGGETVDISDQTLDIEGFDIVDIDIEDGISDIEYIVDNGLLGLNNLTRVSGVSRDDFNQIVSDESQSDPSSSPIIIEAEDLNLTNYLIENYTEGGEEEQLISLLDASTNPLTGERTGEASLLAEDFDLEGNYDLTINYFDENDGEAELQVFVNGTPQGEPLILNEDTSSGLPTEDIRREYTIGLENIGTGDIITIQGTATEFEHARVDYIIFEEISEF